jgi:hypothetical protein
MMKTNARWVVSLEMRAILLRSMSGRLQVSNPPVRTESCKQLSTTDQKNLDSESTCEIARGEPQCKGLRLFAEEENDLPCKVNAR